jgi:hypothetical protein
MTFIWPEDEFGQHQAGIRGSRPPLLIQKIL